MAKTGRFIHQKIAQKTANNLNKIIPLRKIFASRNLKNPFFFIGCGRSGTTLLFKLLSNHPDIAAYPEEANDLWHPKSYPWHNRKIETPPIWINPYKFTELSLQNCTENDELKLKGVFAAHQFFAGGSCFLNKSVMVTFMIDYILEIYPNAKFIHLYRDGRAVTYSFAKFHQNKIKTNPQQYEINGYNFSFDELIDKMGIHWQDHLKEIDRKNQELSLVKKQKLLEISYEDLCDNSLQTLEKITDFMYINRLNIQSNQVCDIKNMNYKYKKNITDVEIKKLESLIAEGLCLKGYK